MYSFEDRMRAVELYIKYGHSVADVIRELGYPNRGSLRNWFREFEESGDLRAGKARPRSFSDEQVRAAVDHYLEHGRSPARTVRAMGLPEEQGHSCRLDRRTRPRAAARGEDVRQLHAFLRGQGRRGGSLGDEEQAGRRARGVGQGARAAQGDARGDGIVS